MPEKRSQRTDHDSAADLDETGDGETTDAGTTDGETADAESTASEPDTEDAPAVESLDDPERLRDRDDVTYCERTYTHGDPDHCESTAEGRVIVGVTNDGEVLLLVRSESSHVILPNCVVESGEDWADAARETAAESTGLAVELDAVECLRRVDHEVETDGEPRHQRTTFHVIFAGTPVADESDRDPVVADDSDWTAGWYDEIPVEIDDGGDGSGDVVDDVRAFLE